MEEKPLGQALLICKDTGKQVKLNLAEPVKPWPTFEPGGYVNDTPCQEFSGEIVVKIKNAPTFRQFQKLLKRRSKLPRKLKKAVKHIQLVTPIGVIEKTKEHTYQVIATEYFKTKNGYPYTKWVRKAIRIATKERKKMIEVVMGQLEKHFEQITEK